MKLSKKDNIEILDKMIQTRFIEEEVYKLYTHNLFQRRK